MATESYSCTDVEPAQNARAGGVFLEIPRPLRAFVRARESSLLFLGAAVGALAGLVVAVMSFAVNALHALFFGLAPGQRLLHKTRLLSRAR